MTNFHSANRGIGLGFVEQLLQTSSNIVIATCRDMAKASSLRALAANAPGTLQVVQLDVTDPESIRAAADATRALLGDSGRGIDYLVNNAGIVRLPSPLPYNSELNCGHVSLFSLSAIAPLKSTWRRRRASFERTHSGPHVSPRRSSRS